MKSSQALLLMVFMILPFALLSQGVSSDPWDYEAWLDSMNSNTYIARSIQLNEVEIRQCDCNCGPTMNDGGLLRTEYALQKLPGLKLTMRGNFAAEPNLRGMNTDRIGVTIDGMRITGACTDKMDPVTSYMESNNMEKVTVFTGNEGYGVGSATGHGLDFQMKKPKLSNASLASGGLGMRYGTNAGSFSQFGDLNLSNQRVGIRANFVHRKAGDYYGGDKTQVEMSQFEKINFTLSGSLRIKEDQFLNVSYIQDEGRDIGYPALPMDVSYAGMHSLQGEYMKTFKTGPVTSLSLKAYGNRVHHVMDDTKRPDVVIHMDMPGWTQTAGFLSTQEWSIAENVGLSSKIELWDAFARAEMTMYAENSTPMFMLTWPDIRTRAGAASADGRWTLSNSLSLSTGGRVEFSKQYMESEFGEKQFEVFGHENQTSNVYILPSLYVGLNKDLGKGNEVLINASSGYRMFTQSEMYGFYIFNSQDGFDYLGNSAMSPELMNKIELGYQKSGKQFIFKANQYNYFFQDYILGIIDPDLDAMTIGARGVKVYENTPNARLHGFEMGATYSYAGIYSTQLTADATYSSDFEGNALPMTPPLKIGVEQIAAYKLVNLKGRVTYAAPQDRVSPWNLESSTPSFWLIDFGVEKNIPWGPGTLKAFIGVNNLFDIYYWEHVDWARLPRQGRNIVFDVFYRF